jgi:hypothetical protein
MEIGIARDRSTAWLGTARNDSNAASASRITRVHRSAERDQVLT